MADLSPHDRPRFLVSTRHDYHDVALIRNDLSRVGFACIKIDTREKLSRSSSAREVATAFCQGTPLRNEIESRARGIPDRG